jgi:regulator of replication initiation timing
MSLYDNLKEMAHTLKDKKQRELYEQLIDLGAQALELQHEVHRLTVENTELRTNHQIENQIERHKEPYLTLRYDSERIIYCARCWDYEKKLVQVKCLDSVTYRCMQCNNTGIYEEVRKQTNLQPVNTKRVFIFVK